MYQLAVPLTEPPTESLTEPLTEPLTEVLPLSLSPGADGLPELRVKRVELFVIRAIDIDAPGYRICMRLTTDQGYGWSEAFLEKAEKPRDWVQWSACLVHTLNTGEAHHGLFDHGMDKRLRAMLSEAMDAVRHEPAQEQASEEVTLLSRSECYISLF